MAQGEGQADGGGELADFVPRFLGEDSTGPRPSMPAFAEDEDPSRQFVSSWSILVPKEFEKTRPTEPGDALVSFRMIKVVGRGGHGEVWESVQESLSRTVAVKRLRDDVWQQAVSAGPSRIRYLESSFRREALITARLDHPNIVPVYDLGLDEEGRPLLAMKLVRGTSWDQLIKQDKALPLVERLARHLPILIDVAQAVAFAHSRGILHRDIKPSQVMVGNYGEVILMDWGIAVRYFGGTDEPEGTSAGVPIPAPSLREAINPAGTPACMAPEQTLPTAEYLGPWTDIFLLGGVLYFLLTGTQPHVGRTPAEIFAKAAQGEVDPPELRNPNEAQPPELSRLCMEAMAKDRFERLPSVDRFIAELKAYLNGASRREESRRVLAEARTRYDKAQGNYEELAECELMLRRCLSLWPENPEGIQLRSRVILDYVGAARASGDLRLARLMAQRVDDDNERGALLRDIDLSIEGERQLRRQRRQLQVLMGLIVVGLVAAGLYFRHEAQVRERTAAQFERYLTDIRVAQSAINARETGEGERSLLNAPTEARSWEWGALMRRCYPELLRLAGHGAGVTSAEFSPDGRRIATGGVDGSLFLWDGQNGQSVGRLDGHTAEITSVEFSRDSRRILSASADQSSRLWDAESGSLLATLPNQNLAPIVARFSPDGRVAATGSEDGTVRLWEIPTGNLLHTLAKHRSAIRDIAWSPNNRVLATVSEDGTLITWAPAAGALIAQTPAHIRPITRVLFTQDSARIVTASQDSTIKIWRIDNGQLESTLSGHREEVSDIVINPAGNRLLSCSLDGTAILWSLSVPYSQVFQLIGHREDTFRGAFSSDGSRIVTASLGDREARVWDAASGRLLGVLDGHWDQVTVARFSPDGTRVLTAARDRTARLWPAFDHRDPTRLAAHRAEILSVAFNAKQDLILTASGDRTARLWRVDGGTELVAFEGHTRAVVSASFSPDGNRVLTASWDGSARIWDAMTGRALSIVAATNDMLVHAEYSPDGRRIVTAGIDGAARLWPATGGAEQLVLRGSEFPLTRARFSADGKLLVTAGRDGSARVWEAESGKLRNAMRLDAPVCGDAMFSPDGRFLATGGSDGAVILWDVATGFEVRKMLGHTALVTNLRFTPDSSRLLTLSTDRSIRLWEVATARELLRMPTGDVEVTCVDFSAESGLTALGLVSGATQLFTPVPWRVADLPGLPTKPWEERIRSWQEGEYMRWVAGATERRVPAPLLQARHLASFPPERAGTELAAALDKLLPLVRTDLPEADPVRTAIRLASNEARRPPRAAASLNELVGDVLDNISRRPEVFHRPDAMANKVSDTHECLKSLLADATGPLSFNEQRQIPANTELRLIVVVPDPVDGRTVFIAGEGTPELSWRANTLPLAQLADECAGGGVWEYRLRWRDDTKLQYKFTYGRGGEGWENTEEYPGAENRMFPGPSAQAFRTRTGQIIVLNRLRDRMATFEEYTRH